MSASRDIGGHRFGRLTAIEKCGVYNREAVWACSCDCGKQTQVKVGNLVRGNTKSCGCLRSTKISKPEAGATYD